MINRLRKELSEETNTHVFQQEFKQMKDRNPALRPFAGAGDLLGLLGPGNDDDAKDDLIGILINRDYHD